MVPFGSPRCLSHGFAQLLPPTKYVLPKINRSEAINHGHLSVRPGIYSKGHARPLTPTNYSLTMVNLSKVLNYRRISLPFDPIWCLRLRPCPASPAHQIWTWCVNPFESH